jgi:hypothetical protein
MVHDGFNLKRISYYLLLKDAWIGLSKFPCRGEGTIINIEHNGRGSVYVSLTKIRAKLKTGISWTSLYPS